MARVGARGAAVARVVLCRPTAGAGRDLRIERKPEYADVRVASSGNEMTIRINIDMSRIGAVQSDEILVAGVGQTAPAFRIPIRFIRD